MDPQPPPGDLGRFSFAERPFLTLWELTRACDLACRHCRAAARPQRSPEELSTAEARDLLGQLRQMGAPLVVFTGGDPLKRPDVFELVEAGTRLGLRMTMTPSGTPLLTEQAVGRLAGAGLCRLAVSLDGPDAASHDAFRRVPGSFECTWRGIEAARAHGLPVQVNTSMCRRTFERFDEMAQLIERAGAVLWSVFFVVPVGRARFTDELTGAEFEELFAKMADVARRAPFDVKSTAAPHYRRYLLEHGTEGTGRIVGLPREGPWRSAGGVTDGRGVLFISHVGEVYPSGFLPLSAGSVREQPLARIYRESELFRSLRDPEQLTGKCGACEFKKVCGGSRARAYAFSGDPLGEEPCCTHEPRSWRQEAVAG